MKKGIVIHCSDSPQGRGDNAETIHGWHKQRKFDGIGYHYVILEDGTIENGRPTYWEGAHAKGYNDYLGVCMIGEGSYTQEQFNALAHLLTELYRTGKIEVDKIIGHYAISSKTCPMFNVETFVESWINGYYNKD